MDERLDAILNLARNDMKLREELLNTRYNEQPMRAFCDKCQELGYDISVGELLALGQDFCDAMIRSVNGGGVNSPNGEWDDMYDMFFAVLEQMD